MSKLHWYLIILMLVVLSTVGIYQIAVTLKLQKTVKEYEQVLERNRHHQEQAIEPVIFEKQGPEGHDAHTPESHESLAKDEMSEDEQTSTERTPDAEEPMVESTNPPESEKPIKEASSEYKEFMERHRKILDTQKQIQAEVDEQLSSAIPLLVSSLNSMTAEEQKEFLKQLRSQVWTNAQEEGHTNRHRQGLDESVDSFINMLKEKGFQPRY